MGKSTEEIAQEVERTRRQLEEKVAELGERIPPVARKVRNGLLVVGAVAVAALVVGKIAAAARSRSAAHDPFAEELLAPSNVEDGLVTTR